MSEPITLLQLLECELTRDQCIRFLCGARKSLNSSDEAFSRERIELSHQIEVLYHAVGSVARNAAFKASAPTPTPVLPTPYKDKFTWADFKKILDEFLDTEVEEELSFSFKEACDYVESAWLEDGKHQWHPEDVEVSSRGAIRWKNNVASILQDSPSTTYSKRRKCWVIL